jgi:hypothetical protein
VADSYFSTLHRTAIGGRFVASPDTAGPWADHLQHGGPPNSLAVAVAESALRDHTGRADLHAVRAAGDFVGPVPVGEIEVTARVVRAARSAALVEVTIAADDRPCLMVRVWFVRDADTASVASPTAALATPVGDPPPSLWDFGYGRSLEWRVVEDRADGGGRAAWVRPTLPLCDGYEYSGLARLVLVADSASGLSSPLDWTRWSFLNVDLDVHLARPVTGDWVLMDAVTVLGPSGSAMARSTLSDVSGIAGAGLQSLVLAPIPTR